MNFDNISFNIIDKSDCSDNTKSHLTKKKLTMLHDVYKINNILSSQDVGHLLDNIKTKINDSTSRYKNAWLKLNDFPEITNKIKAATNLSSTKFENMNIVKYSSNVIHNNHYVAYDINTERGKKYTEKLGQRTHTISIFLTTNISILFPKINVHVENVNIGDCLFYDNCKYANIREPKLERIIKNNTNKDGYLLNIYVREYEKNCIPLTKVVKSKESVNSDSLVEPPVNVAFDKNENYTETLNHVISQFLNNKITPTWKSYKSFSYMFKGNFNYFRECVKKYGFLKLKCKNNSCVQQLHLLNDYTLDHILPMQVIENVLDESVLDLFKQYYTKTIQDGVWALGDRQANRYKAHNEPFSRILHYELLPLIEKITGKKLRPTYTYLSAYKKGTTLPPHTDRPDCEYTVSFVVDKPDDSNWNIYVHKPRQPVKHKGRYDVQPPIDECEPVDCDAGGLMLFQGTDHIHFRKELKHDYYNILSMYYCSV